MADQQQELFREFLIESYENLDRLDGELVVLEEDPGSKETLASIFRTIHTIKGTCGFLEFARLEAITHAGENLLSALRDGEVSMTGDITTGLLQLIDVIRESLAHLEQTGVEMEDEKRPLIDRLEVLQKTAPRLGEVLEATGLITEEDVKAATKLQREGDSRPIGEILVKTTGVTEEQVSQALMAQEELAAKEPKPHVESSITSQNIRVQVEQLDRLMNLAGELVLARNQILQMAAASQDTGTIATAQQLNLITTELQEGIMKIRMQPIGILWSKFPRVVRDLSGQLGKKIGLHMEGKSTELDKTLLEAIKDPLTHLVRNAVDHGIETPDIRLAAGKPAKGNLVMRAFHESGQVNIEIIDDGAGLDIEAIRAKAVTNGLLSPDEAKAMPDRQVPSLIFRAGLSTAKAVTNVSGRGVGMDVVKTNIEDIGGSVEISTEPGKSTTIRIKIPLTLAIIPALIVTAAGDRYAIPQVSLVELVRLDGELAGGNGIEDLHGSPVYRLRGDLLPLVFLDTALKIVDKETALKTANNLVVVRADDRLFGLVVEEINDTEEIVVKPLDRQTKTVSAYAGTTILGDGRVALIIDVLGLALRANVISEDRGDRALNSDVSATADVKPSETYLLLQVAGEKRMAIRLSAVDRLEEFRPDQIEITTDMEVVQYRNDIMPLVRVSEALGLPASNSDEGGENEVLQVVVHDSGSHRVGIVVDAITDIVETTEGIERPSKHNGLEATVVIDGVVTDLLDLSSIVRPLTEDTTDAASRSSSSDHDEVEAAHTSRQLCTFYLGDLFFGVDVMQVQEVLRHQSMTQVPLTGDVVQGLINLRGQTVTALDMRTRLGLPPRFAAGEEVDDADLPMNVVLRSEDGVVSILVDRIGDVVSVEEDDRAEVPQTVGSEVTKLVSGVYKLPGKLLLVLDIEEVVEISDVVLA